MRTSHLFVSMGVALSTMAVSFSARAQEHALPRYEPSPMGDRFFGVHSPYVPGHLDLHAGAILDYAKDSFVFRETATGDVTSKLVDHQLLLHTGVTLALWNRLGISASLPLAVSQGGDDSSYLGVAQRSPNKAALGDLRASARLAVVGKHDSAFQFGIGTHVWIPTGASSQWMSDGSVRAMPYAAVGGRPDDAKRFLWTVSGGPELRPSRTVLGSEQGTMIRGGAGLAYLLGEKRDVQLGAEVNGYMVAREPSGKTTGVELLLSGKLRFLDDFEGGLAFGPGLTEAVGAPVVRGLLSLAYTPRLPDSNKSMLEIAEPVHTEPTEKAAPTPTPLPVAEEKPAPPPAKVETPPPAKAEPAGPSAKEEIEQQRISFALDSAEIDRPGQATIQRVAKTMAANPSAHVVVQGHSDDTGPLDYNQQLSERRARAVKDALLHAGVPKDRIETRGFGPSQPFDDSHGAEARTKNRRVDFRVE